MKGAANLCRFGQNLDLAERLAQNKRSSLFPRNVGDGEKKLFNI